MVKSPATVIDDGSKNDLGKEIGKKLPKRAQKSKGKCEQPFLHAKRDHAGVLVSNDTGISKGSRPNNTATFRKCPVRKNMQDLCDAMDQYEFHNNFYKGRYNGESDTYYGPNEYAMADNYSRDSYLNVPAPTENFSDFERGVGKNKINPQMRGSNDFYTCHYPENDFAGGPSYMPSTRKKQGYKEDRLGYEKYKEGKAHDLDAGDHLRFDRTPFNPIIHRKLENGIAESDSLMLRNYFAVNTSLGPKELFSELVDKIHNVFEGASHYLHGVSLHLGVPSWPGFQEKHDFLGEKLRQSMAFCRAERSQMGCSGNIRLHINGESRGNNIDDHMYYNNCELDYRRNFEVRKQQSFYKDSYHAFLEANKELVAVKNLAKIVKTIDQKNTKEQDKSKIL